MKLAVFKKWFLSPLSDVLYFNFVAILLLTIPHENLIAKRFLDNIPFNKPSRSSFGSSPLVIKQHALIMIGVAS